MPQKKLIKSIGNISDSYIEEALNMPVLQTSAEKADKPSHRGGWHLKLAAAAAILCVGIGALYLMRSTLPFASDKTKGPAKTQEAENQIFTPLRVVAYAAETTDTEEGAELKADVPTTLSKYSAMMSSVPAMPFSFSYDKELEGGNVRFVVSADNMGIMQKYEAGESWKLTEEATSLECKTDEKVYWMPSDDTMHSESISAGKETAKPNNSNKKDATDDSSSIEDINPEDLGADSVITVQVYSGETLLETRYIGISYDGMYYTATLKLNVTMESEDLGDFTIESKEYHATDKKTHEKIRQKLIDKANKQEEEEGKGGENTLIDEEEPDADLSGNRINTKTKKQLEDRTKQEMPGREYGFPTDEYYIKKEAHKK